jgi:hypothetical protein
MRTTHARIVGEDPPAVWLLRVSVCHNAAGVLAVTDAHPAAVVE